MTQQFSLSDFQTSIERTGRRVRRSGNKLLTNCLAHQERNPSMQVFSDGWCSCLAGCGRFHIASYFPEFKDPDWKPENNYQNNIPKVSPTPVPVQQQENRKEYTKYDLFEEWEKLPLIPRDHEFKTIPLEVLDELGWRWNQGKFGMGTGYFIPYFNNDKTKIPFAQVRHLSGDRRFTMLPNAEATVYGKWNLSPGSKLMICEGPSDGAVLDYAMIPWVSMPSASSGQMLIKMAGYCLANHIELVYGGDNDEPGDKLREALDSVMPYRVCQPPKAYKDWGDFLVADGVEAVNRWAMKEFEEPNYDAIAEAADDIFSPKTLF